MNILSTKYIVLVLFLLLGIRDVSAQTFDWVKKIEGESKSMKVDAQGNIYVTGSFNNALNIGVISLDLLASKDLYIAKYNSMGNLLWIKKMGGIGLDEGVDLALDMSGNAYITGRFSGTIHFGNIKLISKGATDIFVAKCNSSGVFEWAKRAGGLLDDTGLGIVIDINGKVCVTGLISGTATIGNVSLNANLGKTFVWKCNADGSHEWVKQYAFLVKSITLDATGNILIAGSKIISFKEHASVLKLNATGNQIWEFKAGDLGANHLFSTCKDITVDASGNIFITGEFNGKLMLGGITLLSVTADPLTCFYAKLNASGQLLFSHKIGGNAGGSSGESILVNAEGEAFITGKFKGSVSALEGLVRIDASGGADILLAKIAAHGEIEWLTNAGSTGNDQGTCLDIDVYGNVFICGAVAANASFGIHVLSISLGVGVEFNSCLTKVSPPPVPTMALKSFTLINADTDTDIMIIKDFDTINVASLPTTKLNIRANTNPEPVGSVLFNHNGGVKVEGVAPYALFGDTDGDYKGVTLAKGAHTLIGTPYSQSGAKGEKGKTLVIRFFVKSEPGNGNGGGNQLPKVSAGPDKLIVLPLDSVKLFGTASDADGTIVSTVWTKISGPNATISGSNTLMLSLNNLKEGEYTFRLTATDNKGMSASDDAKVTVLKQIPIEAVVSFSLIDTDTDLEIRLLKDHDTLNLSRLPKNLNIRANTNPGIVGSVVFQYDATKKAEGTAPYALFGDLNGGDYLPGIIDKGSHTLSATPYSGKGGSGIKGTALTVRFLVIEDETACGCSLCNCPLASEGHYDNSFAAYPNPFSDYATIRFALATKEFVTLDVYDLSGTLAQRLYQGTVEAGHEMFFELSGGNLRGGFYVVRLTSTTRVIHERKISLNK